MMDVHGNSRRVGHDRRQVRTFRPAAEGHDGLDFGVVREAARARQVDGRSAGVGRVAALAHPAQIIRHAGRIAQEEPGRVDDHAVPGLGLHVETPDHRSRERLGDGVPFVSVVA